MMLTMSVTTFGPTWTLPLRSSGHIYSHTHTSPRNGMSRLPPLPWTDIPAACLVFTTQRVKYEKQFAIHLGVHIRPSSSTQHSHGGGEPPLGVYTARIRGAAPARSLAPAPRITYQIGRITRAGLASLPPSIVMPPFKRCHHDYTKSRYRSLRTGWTQSVP